VFREKIKEKNCLIVDINQSDQKSSQKKVLRSLLITLESVKHVQKQSQKVCLKPNKPLYKQEPIGH